MSMDDTQDITAADEQLHTLLQFTEHLQSASVHLHNTFQQRLSLGELADYMTQIQHTMDYATTIYEQGCFSMPRAFTSSAENRPDYGALPMIIMERLKADIPFDQIFHRVLYDCIKLKVSWPDKQVATPGFLLQNAYRRQPSEEVDRIVEEGWLLAPCLYRLCKVLEAIERLWHEQYLLLRDVDSRRASEIGLLLE